MSGLMPPTKIRRFHSALERGYLYRRRCNGFVSLEKTQSRSVEGNRGRGDSTMRKLRQHETVFLGAVIGLMLSFACAARTLAQDTAATQSGEPKKPETEATLFPVPDFTSDIWKRAKHTGDWFGLRTKLGNNGIQLDVDNVHIFQDVASGGIDRRSEEHTSELQSRGHLVCR